MSVFDWDVWQWLAVFQHELLLFAGVFFLIGALDDLAVDAVWLWLRARGRARTPRVNRGEYQRRTLHDRAAIFIPAWQEDEVIGETIAHLLAVWPQDNLRLYVGIYRNDPATLEAAMQGGRVLGGVGDPRLRLVIHDCAGPSTKADCLNRLFQAMRDDERRMGQNFACVIFHDAEDMVDPAGLGLLDSAIADGADFAQLPVEPLPQSGHRWMGSHYCEEFAEAHGKGMVVRSEIRAALPAAGVGCAIGRKALEQLCQRHEDGFPFARESLTEDYELGLAIGEQGGDCRFVRARGEDDLLIATRAYFPARLDHIVRQKTRWVHGIALQGWDRTGWSGGVIESWMRARDRRGPLTALVLTLGYTLLALTLVLAIAVSLGLAEGMPLGPELRTLLIINLVFFAWRVCFRFAFTARNYGLAEGVYAVLRIPLTNVVAIMSGRRAVSAYSRTILGAAAQWDKTPHSFHPAQRGKISTRPLTKAHGLASG
ncbi:glycosyl transferase family protein [Qipengyuania sp. ASV99]|uniref:glycosyl transferase family protein n=1 Tax=Qipengyuania sp. ASV99 TaxID=3399681 RepID=UPI003A4C6D62